MTNVCPDVPYREARFIQRDRDRDVVGLTVDTLVIQINYGWANSDRMGEFYQADVHKNKGKGAHFGIGRKGDVCQYAPTDALVHHSGGRRSIEWDGRRLIDERSVGVVLCNVGPCRERKAKAKRYARRVRGWLRVEHPKQRKLRSWEQFGREQLQALADLMPWIQSACPNLRYVCGREDLCPTMLDPGPLFPWDLFAWSEWGLTRMEKDWGTGRWYFWSGSKRKQWRSAA